jgi:hypothetical protein
MRVYPVLGLMLAVAACSDDPADVEGTYSIAVTNGDNGCELDNWTEGESAQNIQAEITQDGDSASASVGGITGGVLDFWLGGHVFTGTVDGTDLVLTLTGNNPLSEGNCAYTFDAVLDGAITGDVITGEIRYEAQTNGGTDCGTLTGCASVQAFNGTRPPGS